MNKKLFNFIISVSVLISGSIFAKDGISGGIGLAVTDWQGEFYTTGVYKAKEEEGLADNISSNDPLLFDIGFYFRNDFKEFMFFRADLDCTFTVLPKHAEYELNGSEIETSQSYYLINLPLTYGINLDMYDSKLNFYFGMGLTVSYYIINETEKTSANESDYLFTGFIILPQYLVGAEIKLTEKLGFYFEVMNFASITGYSFATEDSKNEGDFRSLGTDFGSTFYRIGLSRKF